MHLDWNYLNSRSTTVFFLATKIWVETSAKPRENLLNNPGENQFKNDNIQPFLQLSVAFCL